MSLPALFYCASVADQKGKISLDKETHRHVFTVLRKGVGDIIRLTDGKGYYVDAIIQSVDKKSLVVELTSIQFEEKPSKQLMLAISLLKNTARFEWVLEKATEIGATAIIPLICERTSREVFKADRFQQIVTSACLQSYRYHFPVLHAPQKFEELLNIPLPELKFIAHCMDGEKQKISPAQTDSILLIGPEGDFSENEVEVALSKKMIPVTLGDSRLRTETAGLVGLTLLRG